MMVVHSSSHEDVSILSLLQELPEVLDRKIIQIQVNEKVRERIYYDHFYDTSQLNIYDVDDVAVAMGSRITRAAWLKVDKKRRGRDSETKSLTRGLGLHTSTCLSDTVVYKWIDKYRTDMRDKFEGRGITHAVLSQRKELREEVLSHILDHIIYSPSSSSVLAPGHTQLSITKREYYNMYDWIRRHDVLNTIHHDIIMDFLKVHFPNSS